MASKNWLGKSTIVALTIMLLAILGIYVFYILYNAEWLIGDDAFMLRRTAFGIPFTFSESILPDWGFFRPFDYLHENIVLLFHSGMHSAFEHYIINAVSFGLCMGALFGVLYKTVKPKDALDYAIVVFGLIAIASRLIGVYINIFGPIFGVYTYHALAVFFLCVFLEKDKTWAMALSLFCWMYSMLIYENVCFVLGCIGFFPLLFAYKQLSKKQRVYCYALIGMAIAFLVAYICIIYLPTRGQSHYDPAHSSGVGMIENAKNMLRGQKFIWLAALMWMWRQVQLLRKKATYHVLYDSLLWAAGGMVIGAVALRLNWTMYYYDAIILSLPAVVYFALHSHEKYGKYFALSIAVLFAVWHSANVPASINKNQTDKIQTSTHMQYIAEKATQGWSVYWYDGEQYDTEPDVNSVFRKLTTENYLQYLLKDRTWEYDESIQDKTIVLNSKENEKNGDIPECCKGKPNIAVGVTDGVVFYEIDEYGK